MSPSIEHITDDNKEYINIYVNKSTNHGLLHFSHEISVTFVKDNDNLVFDSAWHCGVSEMTWDASEEESFENTFPGLLTKLRTEIKADEAKNQNTNECPYDKYNYLYKAKSLTDICKGQWVQGSYIYEPEYRDTKSPNIFTHKIQPLYSHAYAHPIDPNTICRCTGKKDKHDKLIWENDIVKIIYNGKEYIYIVVWDVSELGFKATNGKENYENHFQYLTCCEEIEIIGNVFDNPKLLKKIS